jgi:hypothetical protein
MVSAAMRCMACGADVLDPDIQAMAGADSSESYVPDAEEWGTLDVRKILGVTHEGLVSGSAMRRLGLLGAVLMLVGFLIPVTVDFHDYLMSWEAARTGPKLALLFPAIAGVLAIGLTILPRGSKNLALARAGILAVLGLFTIVYCMPALGVYGRTPTSLPLYWLGIVVSAVAVVGRLFHPTDKNWRIVLAVGAVLTLALIWFPLSSIKEYLPAEFRFGRYDHELQDVSIAMMNLRGMRSGFSTLLMGAWGFLPVLIIPAAALAAWAKPVGLIDKAAVGLRFAGWALLLFLPLSLLVWMFAATGNRTDVFVRLEGVMTTLERFSNGLLAGRVKLAMLATAAAFWLQFGVVTIVELLRASTTDDRQPIAGDDR